MRILHLSASDSGGAGRSCVRLHEGLLAAGHDSAVLVRWKNSRGERILQAKCHVPKPNRIALRAEIVEEAHIKANRSELSNTHYSLGYPGYDVSAHPAALAADILHLHWVTDWLSPISIARLQRLGKPMVWTLHDQRAMTGGCHFTAGCRKFLDDCAACPQLQADPHLLARANLLDQRLLLKPDRLGIVTPSRWLEACARQSAMFRNFDVRTIPYGVDTEVFNILPKGEARKELGLSAEGTFILFGAADGAERRKGFRDLLEALQICARDPAFLAVKPTLLSFGASADGLKDIGLPFHSLGAIRSDRKLRAAYCAADIFALPSLEDNLPNTLLESLACGTAAAAFAAGGIPDAVIENETGRLAPVGDTRALANVLRDLAADRDARSRMSFKCRQLAVERFSLQAQATAYASVYANAAPSKTSSAAKARKSARIIAETGPNLAGILGALRASSLNGRCEAELLNGRYYARRLEEMRAGRIPWALKPRAWEARLKRDPSRKPQAEPIAGDEPPWRIPKIESLAPDTFRVTAIVSTYKSEEFIRGCLEDLIGQTIYDTGELEILVVDSGSPENEGAVVQDFQKRHPNIVYLRTQREPLYAAWNRVIPLARGKYITNANTDDRHRPDALEKMAGILDERPEVALAFGDMLMTRQPNRRWGTATDTHLYEFADYSHAAMLGEGRCGPQPMWRKALHLELGGFVEEFKVASDFEWWLRLSERHALHRIPEPLSLYMNRADSIEHRQIQTTIDETELIRRYYAARAGIERSEMAMRPGNSFLRFFWRVNRSVRKRLRKRPQ